MSRPACVQWGTHMLYYDHCLVNIFTSQCIVSYDSHIYFLSILAVHGQKVLIPKTFDTYYFSPQLLYRGHRRLANTIVWPTALQRSQLDS